MIAFLVASLACCTASAEPQFQQIARVVSPDGAGFEIVAYEPASQSLWSTRSDRPRLTRFDLSDPSSPREIGDIDLGQFGTEVTSVAAHDGLIAAVVLSEPTTDPGRLVLLKSDGSVIDSVPTGAHPDMVVFTPDGSAILVANEGEPSDGVDPDGSVTVYQLNRDADKVEVPRRHTLTLGDRSAEVGAVTWLTLLSETPPSMVEPEFIACSPDGSTAFVSCQENNGIAVVDLDTWPPQLTTQLDLGLLDHRDASPIDLESDGVLTLAHRDVRSMPQPDGIAVVQTPGGLRLLTADEGDPGDVWGRDGASDAAGFERTLLSGETSPAVIFGSRGVSLWSTEGTRLSNSQSIEPWLVANSDSWPDHAERVDRRAPKRGSEPEGVVGWTHEGGSFAAVGFERAGAVGLFRVTSSSLELLDVAILEEAGGRIPSPEGLAVVRPAGPSGPVYLAIADEVAASITILRVGDR